MIKDLKDLQPPKLPNSRSDRLNCWCSKQIQSTPSAEPFSLYIETNWQTVGKVELNSEAKCPSLFTFHRPTGKHDAFQRYEKCAAGAQMQRPPRC